VFPEGRALDDPTFRQILDFLRKLTAVDLSDATLRGHFEGLGPWPQSDSALFLRNRIDHTHTHVYLKDPARYHSLFTRLGVAPDVLPAFKAALPDLTLRPYRLLHGDLHRGNLMYDRAGRIVVIDWSLACMGDPLYDLATLLHLMELPPAQEIKMKARWSRVVEQACPGASRGYADDLKAYLDFKRLESVYTDVHRAADAFGEESTPANLYLSARMIQRSLARARGPLRLPWVPSRAFIMKLLCSWRMLNGDQRFPRTANQPQFGRPYGLMRSLARPSGRHRRVPGDARGTRDTPPPAIVRAASADRSRLMP
jgi:hypothetical protein